MLSRRDGPERVQEFLSYFLGGIGWHLKRYWLSVGQGDRVEVVETLQVVGRWGSAPRATEAGIIGSRLALRNALDHRNTIVEGIRQIAAEHSSPHALAALRSATAGFDPLLLNLANTRRHPAATGRS